MDRSLFTVLPAAALVALLGCENNATETATPAEASATDTSQVNEASVVAAAEVGGETEPKLELSADDRDGFASFISPSEVKTLLASNPDLVLLDVRTAEEYATAHLPGAINLPGEDLRTPSAKPGEGDSQYIFLTDDGAVDVARYEQIFGNAGLTEQSDVVIYGNHAGKTDGTVPAMLLDGLGHQGELYFLDGVGMSEWYEAGLSHETTPNTLSAATYDAQPREHFVWTLQDVLAHVEDGSAIFYDTRSAEEYVGTELRSNARGGHIPGAIHANYAELLTADKTVKTRDEIKQIFAEQGLEKTKANGTPIVLYCQTSTRVSLPYLVLRELGYDNVHVYDASWHEYGNRDDTPIETTSAR